ncbi:hypothetical protein BLA29_013172 [Euroglyphus maynei]|uniref:Uncharacterized protein n=1 Tax=Euroglyphus maynei TaxID=6958 RepID=A0A1Y3BE12_EURMA|nr:hypothetical protein BLA29_013172 [Euroglyphus maynei]
MYWIILNDYDRQNRLYGGRLHHIIMYVITITIINRPVKWLIMRHQLHHRHREKFDHVNESIHIIRMPVFIMPIDLAKKIFPIH